MNNNTTFINPLLPEMSPSAEQILNAYRAKVSAIRGEAAEEIPQSYNPFTPQSFSQGDEQEKHVSQMEQFLSPIKMDSYDVDKAYTPEKHDNFMKNLEEDKAVQEYGPQFEEYLKNIYAAIQQGQITQEQGNNLMQEYVLTQVKPIIDKHHEKGKPGVLHKKRAVEIPEIIRNKLQGVK